MMPVIHQSALDDALCMWLDEAILLLEKLEFLRWPGEKDITMPEALRATLFYALKRAIARSEHEGAPRQRQGRFPSSVISRVQNAISHLSRGQEDEVLRSRHIVFVPQTLLQLLHQMPVAKELESSGRSYSFLLPSNPWAEGLDLDGVDVAWHSSTLQRKVLCARLRARVMWLRLSTEHDLPLPKLHFDNRELTLGKVVLDTLAASLTGVFEANELARYVFEFVTPKLLVVGNDLLPLGRVMVAVARAHDIRSICLVNQAHEGPTDAYRNADRFVVLGHYSKRVLCAAGIEERKIKACGSPYLEEAALRVSKESGLVMADFSEKWIPALVGAASALPSLFFLVLAGDRQDYRKAQGAIGSLRNMRVQLRSTLACGDYAACLKSTRAMLCTNFVSLMEALSLGKQVVALPSSEWGDLAFLEALRVPVAMDEAELIHHLASDNAPVQLELHPDTQRKFFEDYFYRRDGKSSERIAQAILSV